MKTSAGAQTEHVPLHYPLAGPAWEQIRRGLGAIHAEKERRYLEEHGFQYTE